VIFASQAFLNKARPEEMTDKKAASDKPDKLGRTGASRGGRPVGAKSTKSLRQTRLQEVLKEVNPLLAKALKKAEAILDTDLTSDKVSATVQLQAAKLIIDKSIELRQEVYQKEKDQLDDPKDNEDDDEPRGAVLSFSIVDQKK
jgi:hypothetical protein